MYSRLYRQIAVLATLAVGLLLTVGTLLLLEPAAAAPANTVVDACFVSLNNSNITNFSSADSSAVRSGLAAANAGDLVKIAGDCVGVASTGDYTQTVYISKSVTLQGGYDHANWAGGQQLGVYTTTLDAENLGRVAVISGTIDVTLDGLSITRGHSFTETTNGDGGAIYNLADLKIYDSIFYDNYAAAEGGALINDTDGTITASVAISNSYFYYNSAFETGGALQDYGTMKVFSSTFEFNETLDSYGAAIKTNEPSRLTVIGSKFYSNTSASDSGAIDAEGLLMVIKDSDFIENFSEDYGGVSYAGAASNWISNSTFVGNIADYAGAIGVTGPLTVTNSSFTGNKATSGRGGAIDVSDPLLLVDSTVSGNFAADAGGGLSVDGNAEILNSTISSNTAGLGGGIGLEYGYLTMTHVTVSDNRALTATGGISLTEYTTATVKSSIIANSSGGADCTLGLGLFVDGGYNLVEDGTCITAGSSISGDPYLGPLANNGGDTQTQALLIGSPAIDAIPAGSCAAATDQRGVPRPQGSGCDIGAYEEEPLPGISITDTTVSEGDTGTTPSVFTVTLSSASAIAVTVDYETSDGTAVAPDDYLSANGTITFSPGQRQETIVISVVGDRKVEPDKTFYVNLDNPNGGLIVKGQGVGTIINDDAIAVYLPIVLKQP